MLLFMKKCCSVILLCCCLATITKAQYGGSNDLPNARIKFDATRLFEPDNNVSLAFEKFIGNKYSVQLQTDYIYSSYETTFSRGINKSTNGFRVVPEFRSYFSTNKKPNEFSNYIGAQVLYKYTKQQYEREIQKTDALGNNYLQYEMQKRNKSVLGISGLIGTILPLDNNNRWVFDCNFGVGVRYRVYNESADFKGNNFVDFSLFQNNPTLWPNVIANIKLAYNLKAR